ncbi:MAG: DUF1697 domain-containing protein [Acidimicrobiia bacterium]|jgi:uncharacterized protein (DUF1697 family)
MAVHIALLRGINVGGKNRLAMSLLRTIASDLGYTDVVTYIQSGNIVLTSREASRTVAGKLEGAITATTGLDVPVIARTAAEWSTMMAANPFPVADGKKLHVVFLPGPAGDAYSRIDSAAHGPEDFSVSGSHVFLWLPNGIGRSKLAAAIGRAGQPGTARNWNTVVKLAQLSGAEQP